MSRNEWPNPANTAGPGGPSWGQRGLHSSGNACPLHGGSTFRGTRADGAPLTHSPVCNLTNRDTGRPRLVNQHMSISTLSSPHLLFTQPPQRNSGRFIQPRCWVTESICRVLSLPEICNLNDFHFLPVRHVWVLASYGQSQILRRRAIDSKLQNEIFLTEPCMN